jgi:membrane protein DedA with SNARE-associated domain
MFSHELIAQYGVLVVFLSVLGSSLGLPVPAMPTLVTVGASITIATSTRLAAVSHFASMLGAAAAGGLLGDMVWYQGGKRFGERKLRRVCSLALSRDKCLTKTERFFGQWGVRVLIVARFVPGLSLVAVPLCGAMAVRLRYFVAYDCAGVILWASVALAVGGAFAAQIELIFMVNGHFSTRLAGIGCRRKRTRGVRLLSLLPPSHAVQSTGNGPYRRGPVTPSARKRTQANHRRHSLPGKNDA